MRLSHTNCQHAHTRKYENIASVSAIRIMQNSPMTDATARTRIANWLRAALDETKISQADLAREVQKRQINLDQSKISRIINSDRGMSAEELLAAVEVLKVPLPMIGDYQPSLGQSDTFEEGQDGFYPDFSELSLKITRQLETEDFSGDVKGDVWIEASALIYNMLRSVGAWYPDLFEASRKMMVHVSRERRLQEMSFTDYVKSVSIYYRTLAEAEKASA